MTNDELTAQLQATEKELADTKKELDRTKRTLELLTKERTESQRVMTAVMTFVPEINEKIKALSPEELEERTKEMSNRLIEKARETAGYMKNEEPGSQGSEGPSPKLL